MAVKSQYRGHTNYKVTLGQPGDYDFHGKLPYSPVVPGRVVIKIGGHTVRDTLKQAAPEVGKFTGFRLGNGMNRIHYLTGQYFFTLDPPTEAPVTIEYVAPPVGQDGVCRPLP